MIITEDLVAEGMDLETKATAVWTVHGSTFYHITHSERERVLMSLDIVRHMVYVSHDSGRASINLVTTSELG